MSDTPGPSKRLPSRRRGRSAAVPSGYTVSKCPRSPIRPFPLPGSRPTHTPAHPRAGRCSTEKPASRSQEAKRSPTAVTPDRLCVPQSTSTSRRRRSSQSREIRSAASFIRFARDCITFTSPPSAVPQRVTILPAPLPVAGAPARWCRGRPAVPGNVSGNRRNP